MPGPILPNEPAYCRGGESRSGSLFSRIAGTPGKRYWLAASAASLGYCSAFIGSNAHLAIDSFRQYDIAGGLIYSTLMLSHCFMSSIAFTIPTVANISRFFSREDEPREMPDSLLPKVTIQLPIRNEPFDVFRENALSSAINMDYPQGRLQIQVIDNSAPGRFEDVRDYCRDKGVDFIHLEDGSFSKARKLNIGLGQATGDYVMVLDADNRADPDLLKKLASDISADPSLAYVYADVDYWNGSTNKFTGCLEDFYSVVNRLIKSFDKYGFAPFQGFGVLLDRGKLDKVGGWNEDTFCEDWNQSMQLYEAGYKGHHSDAKVHDALPQDLSRLQLQHKKWAFGSVQNFLKWARTFIASKEISFNEKLDFLYRHSFYPSVAFLVFSGAVIAGLGPFSNIRPESSHGGIENWLIPSAAMMLLQPVLSYASGIISGRKDVSFGNMMNFIPGVFTFMGSNLKIADGVTASLVHKNDWLVVTPKGRLASVPTFFNTLKQNRAEILYGSLILSSSLLSLPFAGIYSFLSGAFFMSPILSWLANRKTD